MQFAAPLPWWLTVVVAAAVAAVAWFSYRRPLAPLSNAQRGVLMTLRGASLAAIVIFLARPVIPVAPPASDVIVPVIVDVSRSMAVADADGATRAQQAARLVDAIWPSLSERFRPELFAAGAGLMPTTAQALHAGDQRSDLQSAVDSVRARYRGRQIPGIVLVSDGASTDAAGALSAQGRVPIYAFAIGSEHVRDREIVSAVAGDPRLNQASVDVQVTAVSHGFGRDPFDISLVANGVEIERRALTPAADGSPVTEVFTVAPDAVAGTVFTASIPEDPAEVVTGNNRMSVLVSPAGRPRRILAIFGAPGYDHSFLVRALTRDTGLEVDTVVRKGRDENGRDTFLIQAAPGRAAALAAGFPESREALFAYDAVVIANVPADTLSRTQLALAADFVAARGGGLLVFGEQSFQSRGFIGTALEDVLPVELDDRRGGLRRDGLDTEALGAPDAVTLTNEGLRHPVMRLGDWTEVARRWSLVPPLASVSILGAARPGATILAVTATPNGGVAPLVAVQRYGRGRTLVFAGDGSWRWRMMLPVADTTYESFWRQAVRWVAAPAPDPVAIDAPESFDSGEVVTITVDARNREFQGVAGAEIRGSVLDPSGAQQPLTFRSDASVPGRFVASFRPQQNGLYRVNADARTERGVLGTGDRWLLVGGADRELADPRVNRAYLERLARTTGGALLSTDDAPSLASRLLITADESAPPVFEDLWDRAWTFILVAGLLSSEWVLRRRWGLR